MCGTIFLQAPPIEIEGRECIGSMSSDAQFFPYTLDLRSTRPGRTQVDIAIYDSKGGELLQTVPGVVLDENKTKRLFIYEPVLTYSAVNRGRFVKVAEGGRTIAESTVNFNINVSSLYRTRGCHTELVFGVLSRNDQKIMSPFKALPNTDVYELDERFLPDSWIGYESLDAIIVGDAAFDLMTPLQKQALQDYLISGGAIVVIPAPRADYFKQEMIQQLHPIVTTPKVNGNVVTFEFPSAKRDPTYDNNYFLVGGGTLLVSETSTAQFDETMAENIRSFIENLSRRDSNPYSISFVLSYRSKEKSHTMKNFKEVALACASCTNYAQVLASNKPGTGLVVLVSIIYVTVLVTTVFVLRAKGKMVWNFISTGAISLFFVLVIVIVGYAFKGWSSIQQGLELTVIRNGADAGISVDSAFFYMARGKTYEISKVGYMPMNFLYNVPSTIRDGTLYTKVSADQWTPTTVPFAGIKRLGGPFRIDIDGGNNPTVSNMTRARIEHLFIWSGSLAYYGSVEAGEEKQVATKETMTFSRNPFENARKLAAIVGDEVTAWMIMGVLSKRVNDGGYRRFAICATKSESEFNSTDGVLKMPSRHLLVVNID